MRVSAVMEGLEGRALCSASAAAAAAAAADVSGRPAAVLVVPGMGASLPANTSPAGLIGFFMGKGARPTSLVVDSSYDPLVGDLASRPGYAVGRNVFVAVYDWRLPVAPTDSKKDGVLKFGSKVKFDDKTFKYEVQYLQYWIDQAKSAWVKQYGDAGGFRVDVVGHSLGGVVTRALVQSDYFAKKEAGVVEGVVLVGTPSAGAVDAGVLRSMTVGGLLTSGVATELFPEAAALGPYAPLIAGTKFGKSKIDSVVKSIDDLLPTFAYSNDRKAPRSKVLLDLNANEAVLRGRVGAVETVYGTGLPTDAFIVSTKPLQTNSSAAGDVVVLASSANPDGLGVGHELAGVDHGSLVSGETGREEILGLLG